MGQTLLVIPGTRPPATRVSTAWRFKRALVAVAISAVVAMGVAAPMALRVGDAPVDTSTTVPVSTSTTSTTPTSTTTTSTTVPVHILGATTIREGD